MLNMSIMSLAFILAILQCHCSINEDYWFIGKLYWRTINYKFKKSNQASS